MDELEPGPDWTQFNSDRYRELSFELSCPEGEWSELVHSSRESAAAEKRMLDRLKQALERKEACMHQADVNWVEANAAWEQARDVLRYAELESKESEIVLLGSEREQSASERSFQNRSAQRSANVSRWRLGGGDLISC